MKFNSYNVRYLLFLFCQGHFECALYVLSYLKEVFLNQLYDQNKKTNRNKSLISTINAV